MTTAPRLWPYILSQPGALSVLGARSPFDDTIEVDAFARENQNFYRLVNAANRHAFGGLGMPAWVQLDCCALPSAQIGFCVDRRDLDEVLWESLEDHVESVFGPDARGEVSSYNGPVPISQYCAVSSLTPGTMVGFSLYSLLRGLGLGVRTKALALLCYGCTTQIGLAQYTNPAVRTHCRFGPLKILQPVAWPHQLDTSTFVYELDLCAVDLHHLARSDSERSEMSLDPTDPVMRVPINAETYQSVQAIVDSRGPLAIAPPGQLEGDLLLQLA